MKNYLVCWYRKGEGKGVLSPIPFPPYTSPPPIHVKGSVGVSIQMRKSAKNLHCQTVEPVGGGGFTPVWSLYISLLSHNHSKSHFLEK